MSKNIKLYSNVMSQPSRSLHILLNMAEIPYDPVTIALREGDQFTESFSDEVNKLRTIPCINDEGFKVAGSVTIVRYLAEKTDEITQWYPVDAQKRARVDEYLEWHHLNTRTPLSGYFVASWLIPRKTRKPPNAKKMEKLRNEVNKSLDLLENLWLRSGDFLIDNQLTIADIWAVCEIEQLSLTPLDVMKERPKLKAWMERVRNATNPFYDNAHKTLWSFSHRNEQKSHL
ncbi:glutathione S-transferase theta-3-like [Lutzomyia longipalpis]|uniref:glutathione S-transferase theta-3-like n=1 Tax=Lutzomyia longipalpis TaxID=7200 RepID=UPI0024846269|nr:glutathione S-transferase theta-3-like [Lutzomyia longipalpis]